jgi:hypothetical protein
MRNFSQDIIIYVQQHATLHSLFYLETVLHISGGTTIHHQECKRLFECFVCGVRHPQHTQTGSNSSMIAAGSSNAVTNIRCCI